MADAPDADEPRPHDDSDAVDDSGSGSGSGSGSDSDSGSGSDSDSSPTLRRAKRPRVISSSEDESEASAAENSDANSAGGKSTKGKKPRSLGSDGEGKPSASSPQKGKAGYRTDDSEGENACAICLFSISNRQIGTPDACEHLFCSDCLTEWSTHVNSCPIDRKEFTSVLVRNKIGGKVIKTIPVRPRRISLDDLFEEQPTICQICHSADSEDTMLLCDMCDLGYHMDCLSPPLHQVPVDDWFCPDCSVTNPNETRSSRTASTSIANSSQSTTSNARSGHQTSVITESIHDESPSTSSANTRSRSSTSHVTNITITIKSSNRSATRKRVTRRRRKTRARKTKPVVIEYEIRNGEKFPIKVKKRPAKKRRRKVKKVKRTTKTAARRTLVKSVVRGRLAELFKPSGIIPRERFSASNGPQLSLFGNRNELDIVVSDDEEYERFFGGNGTAVAAVPRSNTSAILDAYRQNRRKTISIPSPTYASSAPDILSSILESQTLFHSKNSSMIVKQDGSIIAELPKHSNSKKDSSTNNKPSEEKAIDLRKTDPNSNVKSAPSYGNSGRGSGNWRGGRGDYYSGSNNNNGNRSGRPYGGDAYHGSGSGNYRDNGNYGNNDYNNSSSSFFNSNDSWSNNASMRNQQPREHYSNMHDRAPQQRPNPNINRGRGNQPRYSPQLPRSQAFPPWQQQNYSDNNSRIISENSDSHLSDPETIPSNIPDEMETNYVVDRASLDRTIENRPLGIYQVSDERVHSTNNPTLPQPPIIRFEKPSLSDDEKTETEHAVTDGDKYDPTEPTIDDSSSEDEIVVRPVSMQNKIKIISPPHVSGTENCSASNTSSPSHPSEDINVSRDAIDHENQQALDECEELTSTCNLSDSKDEKLVESDPEAECPNFSIYSSTSMDIAKNKEKLVENETENQIEPAPEDLIQEDDTDPILDEKSIDFTNDNSKLSTTEEQKESHIQKSSDIPAYEDESQNSAQRGSLSLQSKFTPKRNLIKINLSSNFNSKKKIFNEDKSENSEIILHDSIKFDNNPIASNISVEGMCVLNNKSPTNVNSENFTESISDLEDERSYTPCLDENKSVKSKDTSLEDNDKGSTCIEGLDTELISEDEGNELFSDPSKNELNRQIVEVRRRNYESNHHAEFEEGEIVEKNKQKIKEKVKELLEKSEEKVSDEDRKKKRRDKKYDKDEKDKNSKSKSKKDSDNIFKKLSKSGKERNYRERDDKARGKDKRRSKSTDKENRDKRDRVREKKKEKRKDMERYDVRNIISDKSRRMKDAFGRDKSRPRSNSPSSRMQSPFRYRRSVSRRSPSRSRRSNSRPNLSLSREHRSKSPPRVISNSRKRQSIPRGIRSLSKDRKSISPNRKRSNSVKRRSISPKSHESLKKISLSPRPRSPILRNKRSISPRNRRSLSPRNRRSISPRNRRSISPLRNRRSISPRNKRSPSPRNRRSKSRNRRSISRNRRSISRNRNKRIRRSISRNRRVSPKLHRMKSPRRRLSRRSRSKLRSISRNRSRSPKSKKSRKLKRTRSDSNHRKSRSPIRSKLRRKRSRSFSPEVALSRSLSRERLAQWQDAEKSPLFQDWTSGSQSMSPGLRSPGMTPPLMEKSPEPQNLRVILTTKEKSKKKDKKKKSNKRNKTTDRMLKTSKDTGPSKEVFTSGNNILVSVSFNKNKDVDNVSNMPSSEMPLKKKKRKTENPIKQKKDKNKDKIKKKRLDKEKRSKEIENKKPVAIIDLDKSPFKELTPSPKAIIVLSDSDNGEKEEEVRERQEVIREKVNEISFPQPELESIPNSPSRENNYVTSTGPKTPPEPPIKFTIVSKSNPQLRSVNPLHEDEDETIENQEANPSEEPTVNRIVETGHKGPNTPPDPPNSPPSSPDAYDPFEPTKSGSATPERIPNILASQSEPEKIPEVRPEELSNVQCMSLEAAQKSNLSADDVIQAKPISPTEKVMALLKSTRASLSPSNPIQIFSDSLYDNLKVDTEISSTVNQPSNTLPSPDRSNTSLIPTKVIQPQSTYSAVVKPISPKPIFSTVAPTVVTSTSAYLNSSVPRIGIFNMGTSPSTQKSVPPLSQKITLPSPTKSSPLKSQPPKLFSTKPSPIKSTPIKPMVSSKTLISKLPMPTIKPIPRNQKINKTPNKSAQNGNEISNVSMDIDSPYSPGSSDFGDLFEPPSDNGKHVSAPSSFPQKSTNKFESFDSLFNIKPSSKNTKSSNTTKVAVRQIKKSKGKTVGVKVDEDSLKILDDLPSSAVEMQVKTKFLKKLNRQERVVEEVKLVLKPHYNKKHINKEDYKDILRRAVPKICHNRSGEINPAKIHALIEAYVKKFRKKSHMSK